MVTIGGGKYRSRKIEVPSYLEVPTKSIVRLGIGNALTNYLPDASVLDLFAGSGAVGIELLSRGAKHCVFVDKEKESIDTIKRNLSSLKETGGETICSDSLSALEQFARLGRRFSIIFIDPPYRDQEAYKETVSFIQENNLLEEDGILVIEDEQKIELSVSCSSFREYHYGRTKVTIYWR